MSGEVIDTLAELLYTASEAEFKLDLIRDDLISSGVQDLAPAFGQMAGSNGQSLTIQDIDLFLKAHNLFVNGQEPVMLMSKMDRNQNGLISFQEFQETIFPKMNTIPAIQNSVIHRPYTQGLNANPVQKALQLVARFAEQELKNIEVEEAIKARLHQNPYFEYEKTFELIDLDGKGHVSEEDLYDFMSSLKSNFNSRFSGQKNVVSGGSSYADEIDVKVERVMRRLDMDLDGRIGIRDWTRAVCSFRGPQATPVAGSIRKARSRKSVRKSSKKSAGKPAMAQQRQATATSSQVMGTPQQMVRVGSNLGASSQSLMTGGYTPPQHVMMSGQHTTPSTVGYHPQAPRPIQTLPDHVAKKISFDNTDAVYAPEVPLAPVNPIRTSYVPGQVAPQQPLPPRPQQPLPPQPQYTGYVAPTGNIKTEFSAQKLHKTGQIQEVVEQNSPEFKVTSKRTLSPRSSLTRPVVEEQVTKFYPPEVKSNQVLTRMGSQYAGPTEGMITTSTEIKETNPDYHQNRNQVIIDKQYVPGMLPGTMPVAKVTQQHLPEFGTTSTYTNQNYQKVNEMSRRKERMPRIDYDSPSRYSESKSQVYYPRPERKEDNTVVTRRVTHDLSQLPHPQVVAPLNETTRKLLFTTLTEMIHDYRILEKARINLSLRTDFNIR